MQSQVTWQYEPVPTVINPVRITVVDLVSWWAANTIRWLVMCCGFTVARAPVHDALIGLPVSSDLVRTRGNGQVRAQAQHEPAHVQHGQVAPAPEPGNEERQCGGGKRRDRE